MEKVTKVNPLPMRLTEKERRLIEFVRELRYGEMRIIIQDSEPIRIEELKNSIKL